MQDAWADEVGPLLASCLDDGVITLYEVHADPVTPETTGVRHFFTDQTGVIRVRMNGQATGESPPLF